MRILLIGATHGNELLGPKLYARLLAKQSPLLEHIDFVIDNPRAFATKKRYIDQDLNRSYKSGDQGYEVARAREIEQYATLTQPDLILDMHTTTCVQPSCLIVGDLQGEIKRRFLRASHITTVLQVQPLGDILTIASSVAAYEVPHRAVTPELLNMISCDLTRFIDGTSEFKQKKLFSMSGKIYKKDVTPAQAKTFINFEQHTLGYVPILTGENSYKQQTDYLGFKSPAPEEIEV